MDEPSTDRVAIYRERAAEARAKAEAMRDEDARNAMLQIAAGWELMAETVEKHSPPSN
jgi:hypothetical protein